MLQLQELSHSPTRRKSQTKKATFDADSIHINLVVSESQSFEVGTSNPWLAPPFERSAPPQNANLHPLKVSINIYYLTQKSVRMHNSCGFFLFVFVHIQHISSFFPFYSIGANLLECLNYIKVIFVVSHKGRSRFKIDACSIGEIKRFDTAFSALISLKKTKIT